MPSPSPPPKKTAVKTKKRNKPPTRKSKRKKSREILPPTQPTSEDSIVDEKDDKDEAYIPECNEDTNEANTPPAKKKNQLQQVLPFNPTMIESYPRICSIKISRTNMQIQKEFC